MGCERSREEMHRGTAPEGVDDVVCDVLSRGREVNGCAMGGRGSLREHDQRIAWGLNGEVRLRPLYQKEFLGVIGKYSSIDVRVLCAIIRGCWYCYGSRSAHFSDPGHAMLCHVVIVVFHCVCRWCQVGSGTTRRKCR